ncbi:MAG TPA: DUF2971 domain-containing protein [Gelidibacter sp.]|uniref:DUF2971 domain-containing protein n=1 Tax=Gelidibacter sp. TaxID=2018083 RepID=UPI002BD961C5|nr:DUF2971 domain-containing protein [Gelidibacter sp.]HXJ99762.1 DUF2971 domain-containing protein [Gelidibacter sp.]
MIISREYKPKENDLIYHYCDSNAFFAICTNRKLWMNDLHSMNDFMELHWGYSIWEQSANTRIEKYGKEFLDEIDEVIHFSGFQGLLLANCFSTDKDVLSQWRAYADDGKGYVIGFNAKELLGLPIRALQVLYDKEQQIKEATATIDALYQLKQEDSNEFKTFCNVFGYDLSAFKNPAFIEKKEIRLIHLLDFKKSNDFMKLVDKGGIYFGEDRKGEEIKFRIKQDIPTPYIELDFSNNNKINPIKEVVIGPKNEVMKTAIRIFLETIGIEKVEINKSNASYR